jgi:hypothetical protein
VDACIFFGDRTAREDSVKPSSFTLLICVLSPNVSPFLEAQKTEVSLNYSLVVYSPAKSLAGDRDFNGGGGSVGHNFGRFVTLKGECEGYATTTFTWHPVVAPAKVTAAGQAQMNPTPAGATGTINTQANMFTYLLGPQFNLPIHNSRVFGETLFGGAHTNGYANFFAADSLTSLQPSNNGFSMAIGGGLDFQVADYLALRPVQLDYFLTRYEWKQIGINNQSNLRYQGGVVFRF